ncbi:unnamed protein product, partial [Thlaspi arvense]
MITRSNLAEQLREYQIRSKHDWASVSFFSSTSSFSSSSLELPYTCVLRLDFHGDHCVFGGGGCCSLCDLGASHLSILSVLGGFLVLQAIATRVHLGMCHFATICLHEDHKESEISQEEEAKDASSTIYPQKSLTVPIARLMDEDDSYANGQASENHKHQDAQNT